MQKLHVQYVHSRRDFILKDKLHLVEEFQYHLDILITETLLTLPRASNEIISCIDKHPGGTTFKPYIFLFPPGIYNNARALKLVNGSHYNFSSLYCLSCVHISSFTEITDFILYLIILWLLLLVPPLPCKSLFYWWKRPHLCILVF